MDARVLDVLGRIEARDADERERGLPSSERIRCLHRDSARLLSLVVISMGARRIVEMGSGVGYSTVWLAEAASRTGGRVTGCELNPVKAEEARAHLADAGLDGHAEVLAGDGLQLLGASDEPIDLLFIDSEKEQYEACLELLLDRVRVGGMVVADNVISHGDALAGYVSKAQAHPSLRSVTVPIGRGLEVSLKQI